MTLDNNHESDLRNRTGDPNELKGHEGRLTCDQPLCDEIFVSKHEAFGVGLRLGQSGLRGDVRT